MWVSKPVAQHTKLQDDTTLMTFTTLAYNQKQYRAIRYSSTAFQRYLLTANHRVATKRPWQTYVSPSVNNGAQNITQAVSRLQTHACFESVRGLLFLPWSFSHSSNINLITRNEIHRSYVTEDSSATRQVGWELLYLIHTNHTFIPAPQTKIVCV